MWGEYKEDFRLMSEDARFEDGDDKALNIGAFDQRDLEVVSSLIQDSIFPASEIKWLSTADKLALLINRFRWEDKSLAELRDRKAERVQSLLMVSHVKSISSSGFSPKQKIKFCLFYQFRLMEKMEGQVVF